MRKAIFLNILCLFFLVIYLTLSVNARSGCCSHHNGVCGCSCCDGSPLSSTCAPFYPECSGGGSVQTQEPEQQQIVVQPTPYPTQKPIIYPTRKPKLKPTRVPTLTIIPTLLPTNSLIPTQIIERQTNTSTRNTIPTLKKKNFWDWILSFF